MCLVLVPFDASFLASYSWSKCPFLGGALQQRADQRQLPPDAVGRLEPRRLGPLDLVMFPVEHQRHGVVALEQKWVDQKFFAARWAGQGYRIQLRDEVYDRRSKPEFLLQLQPCLRERIHVMLDVARDNTPQP